MRWTVPVSLLLALAGCSATWGPKDVDGDGRSPEEGDCDDYNADVGPNTEEVWYDGVDENCDGLDDFDQDGDGFASADFGGDDCWDDPNDIPSGFSAYGGATQLTAADVHPGADDAWYDGIDANCGGDDDFDQDGDGHAESSFGSTIPTSLPVDDCYDSTDDVYPWEEGSCSTLVDESALLDPDEIHGGATETWYDGTDQDCGGDDDFDFDGDTYSSCVECDDSDAAAYPTGEPEDVWYDGVDSNCDNNDGDQDGDGYYEAGYAFDIPDGWGTGDCWDDPTYIPAGYDALDGFAQPDPADVFPGADETWYDGVDGDCAGDDDFDQDGDAYDSDLYVDRSGTFGDDCDDVDGAVHPGAYDAWYDGADDDCEGNDDYDQDGDGHDSADYGGDDCDDTDERINPGRHEDCSTEFDDDCDGDTNDLDALGCAIFFHDGDGDSYGDDEDACYCLATAYYDVSVTGDCDDAAAGTNPGVTETTADGIDEDCDGNETCWKDGDGDTYGSTTTTEDPDLTCTDSGLSPTADDCNDASNSVHPGATEVVVNGVDDNCDSYESCYQDSDKDGYGSTTVVSSTSLTCTASGVSKYSNDCDDTTSATSPALAETPGNGVDNNCDGTESCYVDNDLDTYGSSTITQSADLTCLTAGEAPNKDDCNDTSALTSPAATEVTADGIDEDCDGGELCFHDADHDGYGDTATIASTDLYCTALGESGTDDDCNDGSAVVNPAADEIVADGVDEDCDAFELCYQDDDRDGQGSTSTIASSDTSCTKAAYESSSSNDCDDTSASTYLGAAEVTADGIDESCDGLEVCYVDSDHDAYGSTSTTTSATLTCTATGTSAVATDCNDSASGTHPLATEVTADGTDENCDGYETCYVDADTDTYGSTTTVSSTSLSCSAAGVSAVATDCNDGASGTHPGATEVTADGIDETCDGYETCYVDTDHDGYGSTTTGSSATLACTATGYSSVATDCNDGSSSVHPLATETTADDIDENCDGYETCYTDNDHDGQGSTSTTSSATVNCSSLGVSKTSTDCNDASSSIYSGATETPADGVDESCDGYETCYVDADGDTYGTTSTTSSTSLACSATGVASRTGDCNDGSTSIHTGATETTADGIDENCDGYETCYVDTDADTYGTTSTTSSTSVACSASGVASRTGDCNDSSSAVHTGATETTADGIDENCDGYETCYVDNDGDGEGGTSTTSSSSLTCSTSGVDDHATDCDDTSIYVKTGATELCDGKKNDCGSSWVASDEDDLVSFDNGSTWSDVTAQFAGTSTAPLDVPSSTAGTYHICSTSTGDPWYAGVYTTKDITITGVSSSGTAPVLSRNGLAGTTLYAYNAGVTVSNLTMVGGLGYTVGADTYGGVFYGKDTTSSSPAYAWTFSGVTMSGGSASSGGTAYVSGDSTATFTSSTLTGGSATDYGGGIYLAGSVDVYLTNSVVSDATAGIYGGGAYVGTGGTITCSGGSGTYGFVDNVALTQGGGIYFATSSASAGAGISATTCDFTGNTVTTLGDSDVDGNKFTAPVSYNTVDQSFTCDYNSCPP